MKKGDLSLNYVVIAAIALVVLVVIILFFTGGLQSLFQQQQQAVSGATDQQKEIWRGQCKLYCSLGQKENFVSKKFRSESGDEYGCKTLDMTCGVCTGAEAGCAQQRDSVKCKAAGCLWEAW